MSDEVLTRAQRNALFALMAAGGEISNVELEDRYGADLTGREREQLNALKMVASHKVGRRMYHELLDAGWVRCREELATSRAPRGNIMLFAVMSGLGRYFEATGNTLADIFAPPKAIEPPTAPAKAQPGIDDKIRSAYRTLANRPGSLVRVATLRGRLASYDAETVDNALRRLATDGKLVLVPQEDQKRLTKADRQAAVRFGDRDNHLLAIGST